MEYTLFIEGVEWIIIILLFFLFIVGSKGLPEIGKNIGRAVGEYQKARKSLERINNAGININITRVSSEREKLERIATALNIEYKDKSDKELRELIENKLKDM